MTPEYRAGWFTAQSDYTRALPVETLRRVWLAPYDPGSEWVLGYKGYLRAQAPETFGETDL